MSNKTFPGYWRYIWMYWMQPVLLYRTLLDHGIDIYPRPLVTDAEQNPFFGDWLKRNGFMALLSLPLAGALLLFFSASGDHVDFLSAFSFWPLGVAGGMMVAMVSEKSPVAADGYPHKRVHRLAHRQASGVTSILIGGVAAVFSSVVLGTLGNTEPTGIFLAGRLGMVVLYTGLMSQIYRPRSLEIRSRVGFASMGEALREASRQLPFLAFCSLPLIQSPALLAAIFPVYLCTYLRLWIWPVAAIRQLLANRFPRWMRPPILDYDSLCFPIPFLQSGTLRLAQTEAQEVLAACTRSPGCVTSATQIRAQLQANELTYLVQLGLWQQAADRQGFWLAGSESSPRLQPFVDLARFVQAACQIPGPRKRYDLLNDAHDRFVKRTQSLTKKELPLLKEILPVWNNLMLQLLECTAYERMGPLPATGTVQAGHKLSVLR